MYSSSVTLSSTPISRYTTICFVRPFLSPVSTINPISIRCRKLSCTVFLFSSVTSASADTDGYAHKSAPHISASQVNTDLLDELPVFTFLAHRSASILIRTPDRYLFICKVMLVLLTIRTLESNSFFYKFVSLTFHNSWIRKK